MSDRQRVIGTACIAVMEDEPEIARMLRDILECEGYVVLTFLRPSLFEPGILRTDPDLFLIDMMLPEMDGLTFAEHVRDDGYSKTPMIALSASPTMCHAALHSRLFQDTIAKPFDLSVLLASVGRLVGAPQQIATTAAVSV